jgi:hypothetical protein
MTIGNHEDLKFFHHGLLFYMYDSEYSKKYY